MLKNKKYHIFFSAWLVTLITLIGLIIIVGGLTRLTDSGLSITKWELFIGILPPLTAEDWEYYHRLLGRVIGLFFIVPFFFLIFKNVLKKNLLIKLFFIFILILLQGLIGWYMVKSGLTNNVSVSHYRLAFHLFTAFIIFSSLIWIFMNTYTNQKKFFFQLNLNFLFLKVLIFLIFIQIIIGAFVSGLDAGKIYQTWPLMNGNYIPDDYLFKDLFNFNNRSFVQFVHRNIAYLIFILTIYSGIIIYRNKITWLYNSYIIFFLIIVLQILLGVTVLFTDVNIFFASMHQVSSIILIVSSLNLYYRSIRS